MSQPTIDWNIDLQPEPEEEYEVLLRALRRIKGFGRRQSQKCLKSAISVVMPTPINYNQ